MRENYVQETKHLFHQWCIEKAFSVFVTTINKILAIGFYYIYIFARLFSFNCRTILISKKKHEPQERIYTDEKKNEETKIFDNLQV